MLDGMYLCLYFSFSLYSVLVFHVWQKETWLPNISLYFPQSFLQMLYPCAVSMGAVSTHPSFPAAFAVLDLALPFVSALYFSQVPWYVWKSLLFALDGTKLFKNLQVELLYWYFSCWWLDVSWLFLWLAIGKWIMNDNRKMRCGFCVCVCSYLLKFLIKEQEARISWSVWVAWGTEWLGRKLF